MFSWRADVFGSLHSAFCCTHLELDFHHLYRNFEHNLLAASLVILLVTAFLAASSLGHTRMKCPDCPHRSHTWGMLCTLLAFLGHSVVPSALKSVVRSSVSVRRFLGFPELGGSPAFLGQPAMAPDDTMFCMSIKKCPYRDLSSCYRKCLARRGSGSIGQPQVPIVEVSSTKFS